MITTDDAAIDHTAARAVPRAHSSPSTIGTNSAPVSRSYATVNAPTTSLRTSETPTTATPMMSVVMRVATIGFETFRTSVSRSLATIVDEASSAAEAVDMIAASAAASTSPVMPIGSTASVTAANASSGLSSRGTTTFAAAPISAPATP